MKKHGIKRGVMFFLLFIVAVPLFGLLVMSLWNAILPEVIGVRSISFWQALGILLLSKILFGGFGSGRHNRHRGREKWIEMKQKFAGMSAEEREKFKDEWKNRCGGRWSRFEKEETQTPSASPER